MKIHTFANIETDMPQIGDYMYRNTGNEPLGEQGYHNWDTVHDIGTNGIWYVHNILNQHWRLDTTLNLWERIV
jgi:hypothetical protein